MITKEPTKEEEASTAPKEASASPVVVCDVCQERPALVTIGCVDYCAPCAPEEWK